MTPDEIKTARKATGLTQRDFAEALAVDVVLVRDWEKGDRFPTKAHCDAMQALAANPPPKKKGGDVSPLELLADPAFHLVLRKLLAHAPLRAAVEKLAAEYPDPVEAAAPRRNS